MIKIENDTLYSLIEDIKNDDKQAYKEFFLLFQPSVFYFIYRFTSDKQAAEDLTQDTFIKFWQFRAKLDLNSSPKAYLFKIARNLSLNYITRKPPVDFFEDEGFNVQKLNKNYDKEIDRILLLDDYQKGINLLPERCRAAFILSRYEGMEYIEIAETLQVSLQTVKNQISKALSFLRKYLHHHID